MARTPPLREEHAAAADDEAISTAPERAAARRIDQTAAARNPRLSWHALDEG